MKIVSCKRSSVTAKLMRELMPEEFKDLPILINLGYSGYTGNTEGMTVYNNVEAIKNSVDKKRMFELFKEKGVKCVDYLDLKKGKDRTTAEVLLDSGKFLAIRDNGDILIAGKWFEIKDNHTYATLIEPKVLEYRVIVFKGKIIKIMVKLNEKGDFQRKHDNCRFAHVNVKSMPLEMRNNVKASVNALGLDLAGVDVLLNDKGEFKVIEVNSGMALNEENIGRLFKQIGIIHEDMINSGDYAYNEPNGEDEDGSIDTGL